MTALQTRLGVSFRLTDGDLVLDGAEPALVAGQANLVQALTLRLLTPYGTDRVNATYGLDVRQALSGNNDRATVKELIRLEVLRTLAADPRVSEVTSVLFDDDPEFLAQAGPAAGSQGRASRVARVLVTVQATDDTTVPLVVDVER